MRWRALILRLIGTSTFLCAACSERITALDAQGSTSAQATTTGNSSATTEAPEPPIDDEYCAQFDEDEAACQAAAAPDAPIQCTMFDPFRSGSELVEGDDGPLCRLLGLDDDFEARVCRAVEYTPWACELTPPSEATEVCPRQVPYWFWSEETPPTWSVYFDLPCHFRPVGFETCWENPIPACWCACHPEAPCEGPFCVPKGTTGTGGGTGSTGSTGSGNGTSSGTGTTSGTGSTTGTTSTTN